MSLPPRTHHEYTDMSYCRLSKQELASPVGKVMVGLWAPPPVIPRIFFGRDMAVARWLATRTLASILESIAEAVIQNL
ncbi:hypothetical protein AVEN_58403-1 [Araneus ventricosus]|uniref:Uncharacterized protein n=1 Tax=Araneus ventricosus TaxID=182803 RepID=A0A4Y2F5Y3_ARAVE|nr:hypothetical protein AVEN_58403-1 [Araneus ventricosus]